MVLCILGIITTLGHVLRQRVLLLISHEDQVCEDESCHSLDYYWSSESEADIVAARHLEGVHFACRKVEGLLGFADA